MDFNNIIFELVLIYAGAAFLATLFLYLKQPIILAYIALGVLVGPWGVGLIDDAQHLEQLSHIGIILLLFLIGLNLRPDRLIGLFGRTAVVTLATCFIFMSLVMLVAMLLGYAFIDSLIIGAALMFSSTIVSLKLIPTTALHHRHIGEMMISVLLLQDVIAIILLLLITGGQQGNITLTVSLLLIKLLVLVVAAFVIVKYIITALFTRFDTIREHTFLLSLGWGLLGAGVAEAIGLSYEMGAFVAGVSLATIPIALVIAEDLKPLRDFFLILFFFSIGATFNFLVTQDVILASVIVTLVLMLAKPFVFRWCFRLIGEAPRISAEVGVRLGQGSEFSLLVAYSALMTGLIEARSSYLIQTVVILTFVISTYWVMLRYPTPISSVASRRKD
jgi:Kef-type K+ transport system membrane component KefB